MKKYRIEIDYRTGDSFNTIEHSFNDVGEWDNLDIAKENIRRIKEHWRYYYKVHKCRSYTISNEEIEKYINSIRNQSWYVADESDSIKLLADNWGEFVINPFWCGYFEKLNSATIKENCSFEMSYDTSRDEELK